MNKCAYCGMENEEVFKSCQGCGQPLTHGAQNQTPRSLSPLALERIFRGALWCGGGIIVTVGTFALQSNGGPYLVAWGAMAYGAIQIYRGFRTVLPGRKTSPDARQLLQFAAYLESVDPRRAIDLYRQIARQSPGTTASAEAERNIKTLIAHHPSLAPQVVSLGISRN